MRTLARRVDSAFILTGTRTLRQHMFNARKLETVLTGIAGALALLGLVLAAAGFFRRDFLRRQPPYA